MIELRWKLCWILSMMTFSPVTPDPVTAVDCNNGFPQYIGYTEEPSADLVVPVTLVNPKVTPTLQWGCSGRVVHIQLMDIDVPNITIQLSQPNANEFILYNSGSAGVFFTYYPDPNEIENTIVKVNDVVNLIFPSDVETVYTVNGSYSSMINEISLGFLVFNMKVGSVNTPRSEEWRYLSTQCLPANGFYGNGSMIQQQKCYNYEVSEYVAQDLCEEQVYHLEKCEFEPEWSFLSQWSACEALNTTLDCGNGSRWRTFLECKDTVTDENINSSYCGEEHYHSQHCYIYCPDEYFWHPDKWTLKSECTPLYPTIQGSDTCGNGVEEYEPWMCMVDEDNPHQADPSNCLSNATNIVSCYWTCEDLSFLRSSHVSLKKASTIAGDFEDIHLDSTDLIIAVGSDWNTSICADGVGKHIDGLVEMPIHFNRYVYLMTKIKVETSISLELEIEIASSNITLIALEQDFSIDGAIFTNGITIKGLQAINSSDVCFEVKFPEVMVPGVWGMWSNWSICDGHCNNGTWNRTRDCYTNESLSEQIPTQYCVGKFISFDFCKCLELYAWDSDSGEFGECQPVIPELECGNGIEYRYPDKCYYNGTELESYYEWLCLEKPIHAQSCFKVCLETCGGMEYPLRFTINNEYTKEVVITSNESLSNIIQLQIDDFNGDDKNFVLTNITIQTTSLKDEEGPVCQTKPFAEGCYQELVALQRLKEWGLYKTMPIKISNIHVRKASFDGEPALIVNGTLQLYDYTPLVYPDNYFERTLRIKDIVGCEMPSWSDWYPDVCNGSCSEGYKINGTVMLYKECQGVQNGTNVTLEDHYCVGERPIKYEMCQPEEVCFVYGNFSEWTDCNGMCGKEANQNRTRPCYGDWEVYPPENCTMLGLGDHAENRSCYLQDKPCLFWKRWSEWSEVCGNDTRTRSRGCLSDLPLNTTQGVVWSKNVKIMHNGNEKKLWLANLTAYESQNDAEGVDLIKNVSLADLMSLDYLIAVHHSHCVERFNLSNIESEFIMSSTPCYNATDYVEGECSETCGSGTKLYTRECFYYNDTKVEWEMCSHLGEQNITEPCEEMPCSGFGEWSVWSVTCSKPCNVGKLDRSRDCFYPHQAMCIDVFQEQDCNVDPCPIDGYWKDWHDWTPCLVSCGNGTQERHREYVNALYNGTEDLSYKGEDIEYETRICETQEPCPGAMLTYEMETCDSRCQDSGFVCNATILTPHSKDMFEEAGLVCMADTSPLYGKPFHPSYNPTTGECMGYMGSSKYLCNTTAPEDEKRICNCISYDEVLVGEWSAWGECSVSCDDGIRKRSRVRTHLYLDTEDDFAVCNLGLCPVDGGWSEWSDFMGCSATCGYGTKKRMRYCNNPPASLGGNVCYGKHTDVMGCGDVLICPIHGNWSNWSNFTGCDMACGDGGERHRYRNCNSPVPEFNGEHCTGSRNATEPCQLQPCKVVKVHTKVEFIKEIFEPGITVLNSTESAAFQSKVLEEVRKMYASKVGLNVTVQFHSFENGTGEGIDIMQSIFPEP